MGRCGIESVWCEVMCEYMGVCSTRGVKELVSGTKGTIVLRKVLLQEVRLARSGGIKGTKGTTLSKLKG